MEGIRQFDERRNPQIFAAFLHPRRSPDVTQNLARQGGLLGEQNCDAIAQEIASPVRATRFQVALVLRGNRGVLVMGGIDKEPVTTASVDIGRSHKH